MISLLNSLSSSSHWYARALFYPLGMMVILGDAIFRFLLAMIPVAIGTVVVIGFYWVVLH